MLRALAVVSLLLLASCASHPRPGAELKRTGDEIVVGGRYFHTGAPVVLWTDPGGYDAYRVERRFVPREGGAWEKSAGKMKTPNRYGVRCGTDVGSGQPTSVARGPAARLSEEEMERV